MTGRRTAPGRVGVVGAGPRRAGRAVRRVEGGAAATVRRAALLAVTATLLLPLAPVVVWAFADRWTFPDPLPAGWGLAGWRTALDQGALAAVGRSAALGLVVSALATPVGALAGRALAARRVPAGGPVTLLLLLPVAVPPFAMVLGLGTATLRAGVPGTAALVAVLVAAAVPYSTVVMRSAYARYDPGYEEVGRTLGASGRLLATRVRLPLLAPALAVAAFLSFLVAWSDYVFTLVLAAGRLTTVQQLLGASASGSGNQPTTAALALLAALPPLLLLGGVRLLTRGRSAP